MRASPSSPKISSTRPDRSPVAFPARKTPALELQEQAVAAVRQQAAFHVGACQVKLVTGTAAHIAERQAQRLLGLIVRHAEGERPSGRGADNLDLAGLRGANADYHHRGGDQEAPCLSHRIPP